MLEESEEAAVGVTDSTVGREVDPTDTELESDEEDCEDESVVVVLSEVLDCTPLGRSMVYVRV